MRLVLLKAGQVVAAVEATAATALLVCVPPKYQDEEEQQHTGSHTESKGGWKQIGSAWWGELTCGSHCWMIRGSW